MSSEERSKQPPERQSRSSYVPKLVEYLQGRTAAGDSRFTASGVSRALEFPSADVRALLGEVVAAPASLHMLDIAVEYECPKDASTVLTISAGERLPEAEVMTCPTSGHEIVVADCGQLVTFRPSDQLRGAAQNPKLLKPVRLFLQRQQPREMDSTYTD